MFSSLSTATTMFSGLVIVAMLRAFGSCTGTAFTITGMVTRKMMSRTSITSTSGVVLIVVFSSGSSPSADATCMAMVRSLDSSDRVLFLAALGDQISLPIAREAPQLLVDHLVAANEVVVE